MKISITLKELIEAGSALDAFQAMPLRANHSFRVASTLRAIRQVTGDYFETQEKILNKHGLKSMPVGGGQVHILPQEEDMKPEDIKEAQKKFIAERDALYADTVDLNVNSILLSAFYKENGKANMDNASGWFEFAADDMAVLNFLIEDDVTPAPIAATTKKLKSVK